MAALALAPPPSTPSSPNNSPAKLTSSAALPPSPSTASSLNNSPTKLSPSATLPPSPSTASSPTKSPTKLSSSAALPAAPTTASAPKNSLTKLSPSAALPHSHNIASFSCSSPTKLPLSVVVPPSPFTAYFSGSSPTPLSSSATFPPSSTSPTKLSSSDAPPTSPVIASSSSSIPPIFSSNSALPLSKNSPTKSSAITVPPSPNIASSSNSPTNLSPSAALSPFSSTIPSSNSSPTELSPTATLPPSSTSPTKLSAIAILPSSASIPSSSNSTPTKLSPNAALPPPSSSPTKLSPSNSSPTELSLSAAPKLQKIAALPPSNAGQKSPPTAALPPSPNTASSSKSSPTKLLPIAALPHSPSTASSSSSGLTINVSDLQCCIDDVMSALVDKAQNCRLVESGNKLKDTVQHVSSDFSKVFGTISEGTKIIADQKSCLITPRSQGHSVASEIIKEVANIHWAAIGLLTIANVLERFDKISVNDRDCFDLLKVMLDLAKVLKQLKDNSFDLHKDIAEKMVEALWLICSGAKLCRSFIAHKKILKFFFTTKIRDDLVYIRRKMDSVIVQLSLQIQIKDASFNNSRRQPYSDSAAVDSMLEPTGLPSEHSTTTNETIHGGLSSDQQTTTNENSHSGGLSSEQSTTADEIVQCDMENAAQTETCAADTRIGTCTTDPNVVSQVNEGESDEAVSCKETNKVERPQKSKRPFFRFPAYLKKFKERRSPRQRKQKPAKKVVLGISMDKRELSSFSIEVTGEIPTIDFTLEELKNATNGLQHQLKSSHARFNMFKGTLPSGRQVQVRTFPCQQASSSEQDNMKIMLNELGCMLHLRHKNILKLVGFCNIEKEEPMLVYDYPPNGRLCEFLSGDSKKKKVLDWSERSKIIMGVISALVYLHEAADEHKYWVHGDIKPENILLDGNFNAKLSDFSLARVLALDDSSSGDSRMKSCESSSRKVSYDVDIYSFGILVLQVVSGRDSLPTTCDDHVVDLRMRAWSLHKEDRLQELIDPQLLQREGCEFGSIIRSIKIALWCVVTDPSLRPKTSQVSAMLSTEQEICRLPDDSMLMEAHSDECYQSHQSDESVRSVKGGHSEVGFEVEEPRA